MAISIKNILVSLEGKESSSVPGCIDVVGVTDTIIKPIFPAPMKKMAIVMFFQGLDGLSTFEARIIDPEGKEVSKGEFAIAAEGYGFGKKVINLENFAIVKRGSYQLEVFEKKDDELNFIEKKEIFLAEYPPQRELSSEQKQEILSAEGVIKFVRTEFKPNNSNTTRKLQLCLDPEEKISEGYEAFPESNELEIDGVKYNLTGMRRQIEWMFGRPIPKKKN